MQEEQSRNVEPRLTSHRLIAVDSPPSPSGLGFLRQESVLTAQEQESMWVGWPGVATAAERRENSLSETVQPSAHTSPVGKPFLAWRWAAESLELQPTTSRPCLPARRGAAL